MKPTISTLGLLALGANAIMIPPTVSLESLPSSDVGTTSLVDPYTQLVEVPCPGCMYAQPHEGGFIWTQGVENSLLLNISVGANPSSLELNGVQFYPPLMTFGELPIPSIAQVPSHVSLSEIKEHPEQYTAHPLRLTSWSFHAGSASTINDEGHELLSVSLHLGALEMQDINVPDVAITALKDSSGALVILRVDQTPAASSPMEKGKECQSWPLVCKWKAMLEAKLQALRGKAKGHGCGGAKKAGKGRPHGRPMIADGEKHEDEKQHGKEGMHKHKGEGSARPHRHGHGPHRQGGAWHKHHRHHKLHRILHAIGRVLLTVFIPILIGVVAGMVLYLMGYVLGATLGFVVTRLFGRRAAGYQPVALVVHEEPRGSMDKFEYKDEERGEAPPEYVEVEVEREPVEKE